MAKKPKEPRPDCGLVMPISDSEGYPAGHWKDVKSIIEQSLSKDFEVSLVSEAPDSGVIHARIVQNLFENPIVVVDVSGRNANVMTELGIRLATDQATVLIKDEKTPFSFDTQLIEHLPYRSDLHHGSIEKFKAELSAKVKATLQAKKDAGDSYSPFLRHFPKYKPKKLETVEESQQDRVERKLNELASQVAQLLRSAALDRYSPSRALFEKYKKPTSFSLTGFEKESSLFPKIELTAKDLEELKTIFASLVESKGKDSKAEGDN